VLLETVARGERGPVLRSYCPRPTVAFGRRDTFLSGFAAAVDLAHQYGFAPVIRAPGGRAAAYDEGCLVIDEIMPDADSLAGIQERFAGEANRQAQALRGLGLDARVGEVPGEYCPGAFTVNAAGQRKLIGAAQRVIRGAWLLSTIVVVQSSARIRGVLERVYGALALDWDPDTVGAVAEEAPGVGVDEVQRALLAGYAQRYRLVSATVSADALATAQERVKLHLPK
jgi:lipoate-protein ligase A